jgi:hypothetical protein
MLIFKYFNLEFAYTLKTNSQKKNILDVPERRTFEYFVVSRHLQYLRYKEFLSHKSITGLKKIIFSTIVLQLFGTFLTIMEHFFLFGGHFDFPRRKIASKNFKPRLIQSTGNILN